MVSASEMERHPADSEIRAHWDISARFQRCNKFFCASWSSSQQRSSIFIKVRSPSATNTGRRIMWVTANTTERHAGTSRHSSRLKRRRTVTRGLITRSGFMRFDVLCMYNCWCSYAKDKIYKIRPWVWLFPSRKKLVFFLLKRLIYEERA